MAVSLLDRNYQTNYCEFSYDDWNTDKDSIPTMNTAGKGILFENMNLVFHQLM